MSVRDKFNDDSWRHLELNALVAAFTYRLAFEINHKNTIVWVCGYPPQTYDVANEPDLRQYVAKSIDGKWRFNMMHDITTKRNYVIEAVRLADSG